MPGTVGILRKAKESLVLTGDDSRHEQTDAWSNRDLIPLPPSRRTWGIFNFFAFHTGSSLNISAWQTPNTYLTMGLSIKQSMGVIIVARAIITFFTILISWCGLKWHVGFTVQSRHTWGLRGSYIPLIQRIILNFMWTAIQCWNGGRTLCVCLVAIWPSFANIKNTFGAHNPTTTYQFVGFVVFWFLSTPFLFIRPENYKRPYQIVTIYTALAMLSMFIWSLSVAKGVGPVFTTGESVPASSKWNVSWIMMAGINSMIGGSAAGMANGSDFARYARGPKQSVIGTVASTWMLGIIVSFVGLVTTGACQKIYGQVYWNPPDLLMKMMDSGKGSSKARAGVFFISFAFSLNLMFENIFQNAVAGGIDLAGLFPRYINIRRGALITFVAVWICQPWQLVNKAATFVTVLNSFSVFFAPIMGVMFTDYYFVQSRKIKLSNLYHPDGSIYWFYHGFNLRTIPAWIAGWMPTIGGLIATIGGYSKAPRGLFELYRIAFFLGFSISAAVFYLLNVIWPAHGLGQIDDADFYGTFTVKEATKIGVVPLDAVEESEVKAA